MDILNVTPTIGLLELIWTLMGAACLGVTGWMLYDCVGDKRALREAGLNGYREVVAAGNIRSEIVSLIIMAGFVAIGIYAMTIPPRVPDASGGQWASLITVIVFVLAGFLLTYNAVMNRLDRHKIVVMSAHVGGTPSIMSTSRRQKIVTTKRWWESKTMIFNIVTVVVFAATYIAQNFTLPAEYADTIRQALGLIAGVGNLVLRLQTSAPIDNTKPVGGE